MVIPLNWSMLVWWAELLWSLKISSGLFSSSPTLCRLCINLLVAMMEAEVNDPIPLTMSGSGVDLWSILYLGMMWRWRSPSLQIGWSSQQPQPLTRCSISTASRQNFIFILSIMLKIGEKEANNHHPSRSTPQWVKSSCSFASLPIAAGWRLWTRSMIATPTFQGFLRWGKARSRID